MRKRDVVASVVLVFAAACGGSTSAIGSTSASTARAESSSGETTPAETTQSESTAEAPARVAATPPAEVGHEAAAAEWASERNPNARYIVAVGIPTARDESVEPDHLAHARRHAARTVASLEGVELAPPHFDHRDFESQRAGRALPGIFLECSIVHHDVDARGTHFAVSVAIVALGSEDVLATLQGRATAPGTPNPDSDELALEGALDSALRGLPQVLVALD